MPDLDIAYVAGIIDARGHIEVDRARLSVTTKRHELLEWLAGRTGITVRYDDRGYTRRGCSEHCNDRHIHMTRQSSVWTVRGLRAGIILSACLPWMVVTRSDAVAVLRDLTPTWPTDLRRNEIGASMARLGWPLPTVGDLRPL